MLEQKSIEKIKKQSEKIRKPAYALVFLLFLDFFVFVLIFSLNHVFRPDILAMVVYLSLYAYLLLTRRKQDIVYLLISSLIALGWTILARNNYEYNQDMIRILGINAFPVFAWSSGLAALYLLYSSIEQIFMESSRWIKRFFVFSVLYLFFIIILETIAYHVFGIKNVAAEMYSGLPICDCIHAPVWMQFSYFLIGPVYFVICSYFKHLRTDLIN